jgi:hypothetical protein
MALATSLAVMWDDGGIPRYVKLGILPVRVEIPTSLLLIMINEYSGWAVENNAIHMV